MASVANPGTPRNVREMLDASKVAHPIIVRAFTPDDVVAFERKWNEFSAALPLPEPTPTRKGPGRVKRDAATFTVLRDAPLIAPGKYLAIYVGSRKVWVFHTSKVYVDFKVYPRGLECPEEFVVLHRHFRVEFGPNGRLKGSPHCDFVRELQAVLGRKVRRPDRLSPSGLRQGRGLRRGDDREDGQQPAALTPDRTLQRHQPRARPAGRAGVLMRVRIWPRGAEISLPPPELKGRAGRTGGNRNREGFSGVRVCPAPVTMRAVA